MLQLADNADHMYKTLTAKLGRIQDSSGLSSRLAIACDLVVGKHPPTILLPESRTFNSCNSCSHITTMCAHPTSRGNLLVPNKR